MNDERVECCYNCEHFHAENYETSMTEIYCGKGHWDGVMAQGDLDALYDKCDCEDFKFRKEGE